MDVPSVSRHLIYHAIGGALAGLVFAGLLLVVDAGMLRTLLEASPEYTPVFFIGGAIAFAPLVITGAFALLRTGKQAAPARRPAPAPLR